MSSVTPRTRSAGVADAQKSRSTSSISSKLLATLPRHSRRRRSRVPFAPDPPSEKHTTRGRTPPLLHAREPALKRLGVTRPRLEHVAGHRIGKDVLALALRTTRRGADR